MTFNTMTRDLSFAAFGFTALLLVIYAVAGQSQVGSWRANPAATTEPQAVSTARGLRDTAAPSGAISIDAITTARVRN